MTVIATALKHMLAAGMAAEAIVAAVAEMEAEFAAQIPVEAQPSKGALRTRRYRERGGGQVSPLVRQQVFERDGYICLDCGSDERLEADHIIPVSKGGETSMDNLQTLCRSCNARKRDRIRKADERGQSRTISDNLGKGGISKEVGEYPAPPLSLSPNEINSNPHTHTPEKDTPRSRKAAAWPCPPDVDPQHWADMLANRKTRRLTNTETAYRGQLEKLAELSDEEWPPGRLVKHAAEKGWGAIHDPRDEQDRRNDRSTFRRNDDRPGARHRQDGFGAALREARERFDGAGGTYDA